MTVTTTRTITDTYTAARANYVMEKVEEDLLLASIRGFVSQASGQEWCNVVTHLLHMRAVDFFELQFTQPNGRDCALRYTVSSSGMIFEDAKSGGFDLYLLPDGTTVTIVVRYVKDEKIRAKAMAYTATKGWVAAKRVFDDPNRVDRCFSKDGYGVQRAKMGSW